ncbi:MAG: C69 family dipeptidase [Gemmatimonadota bacterium]|nr:MAG: C69 family dipeptidase [Gemmatimonadota bacterium]
MYAFPRTRRYLPVLFSFLLLLVLGGLSIRADGRVESLQCPQCESCTSILVGRLASEDGSTMTSHSCDSGTDRTWISIEPRRSHAPGAMDTVWMDAKRTTGPEDTDLIPWGEIPQVAETWKFMNAAYPIMNEHQLAIGETTTGGKRELKSSEGIIDAPELYRILLQRARTAREAIRIADELTKEYGYNDWGECFTFADPQEVWFFEILGPGRGKVGAVWAAVRIPDDEVAVSANSHRILELDLSDPDRYMASENVFSLAEEMGWWDAESGEPFRFAYAYASRSSLYSRRREWRALSLLAPSLGLDPNAENFPLSVKPDETVSVQEVLAIFRDTYEDTPYDMTRRLTVVNREGAAVKSPVANPFMSADMRELLGVERERTIASPFATYVQVTQSRSWLPDPIGGVVWLGYDNPATTPHIPFYIGITQMPESYMVDGRRAFRRDCAWWAFRRASKLAHFRYQDMKGVLQEAWEPIEREAFARQASLEEEALELYDQAPERAEAFLTEYCHELAERTAERYWELGDELWTRFNLAF